MSESRSLVPLSDVKEMAAVAAKSGLFSDIKTPEAALALMLLCQAEGLHPVQALRRYHIINGRPAMKADAMLAEFMTRGGRVTWKETTDAACEGVFESPGMGAPTAVRWTMEDAQRAGVLGNPTWKKYPRQMLRARVISEGIRLAMPAVVVGVYTPEEVADFEPVKVEVLTASPKDQADRGVSTGPSDIANKVKEVFPGAKEVVEDPRKRLGKLFTLPAPEGMGWKKPQIVTTLKERYGVETLSALSDEQVADCEAFVGLMAEAAK